MVAADGLDEFVGFRRLEAFQVGTQVFHRHGRLLRRHADEAEPLPHRQVQQEGDSEALRPPWLRAPVPSVQLDQLHRQCRVARALGRLQPVEFSAPTVRGCEGRSVAPGDPGGLLLAAGREAVEEAKPKEHAERNS
jgi:hypothetical protein